MLFACTQFEPVIYERRLTLDLYHKDTFAKTSKPLQPRVDLLLLYSTALASGMEHYELGNH